MRRFELHEKFNGILAWDSFFRLNRDDQGKMFPLFARHTAPGAALMFTSGPAAGEIIGRPFGDKLYQASLDPKDYRSLLAESGFTFVHHVADAGNAVTEQCGRRDTAEADVFSHFPRSV
jgi:hypothetical protein